VLSTMRAAMQYDNQRVHLQFDRGLPTDGAADLTINTVAIANGRYFGGAMMIAPDAELDDGQFDVVALGDFGTAELMMHSRKIYAGTHLRLAKVSARRAVHVDASPPNRAAWSSSISTARTSASCRRGSRCCRGRCG
jgi:diacylglycerol kinase (ATP)